MLNVLFTILEVQGNVVMVSLTAMLVFIIVFFIITVVININNRKDNDLRHQMLSDKIDNFEKLFIGECRNLIEAVKHIR